MDKNSSPAPRNTSTHKFRFLWPEIGMLLGKDRLMAISFVLGHATAMMTILPMPRPVRRADGMEIVPGLSFFGHDMRLEVMIGLVVVFDLLMFSVYYWKLGQWFPKWLPKKQGSPATEAFWKEENATKMESDEGNMQTITFEAGYHTVDPDTGMFVGWRPDTPGGPAPWDYDPVDFGPDLPAEQFIDLEGPPGALVFSIGSAKTEELMEKFDADYENWFKATSPENLGRFVQLYLQRVSQITDGWQEGVKMAYDLCDTHRDRGIPTREEIDQIIAESKDLDVKMVFEKDAK